MFSNHYDAIAEDEESISIRQSFWGLNGGWRRWLLVVLNIILLLLGQVSAVMLGSLYFDKGGTSKWMQTLTQTGGFPVLFLPLFFFRSPENPPSTAIATATSTPISSFTTISLTYFFLGLLQAGDNMMYSIGLSYLPLSTYSLISATQLAFNSIFSFFINSNKFTALILNSVVLLTFSACLVAIDKDSAKQDKVVSDGNYVSGFLYTIGASALYSLILSLMQLSFEKVLKREDFRVVLDMQIYTSLVASCVCLVGLFFSGEWRGLKAEMDEFGGGKVYYVMTLVVGALAWQMNSIGLIGLIFLVSSLFSNVISTVALPLVPVAAVIFYNEKMDGVVVVAMLMAIWGFISYLYQNYLDDCQIKSVEEDDSTFLFGPI